MGISRRARWKHSGETPEEISGSIFKILDGFFGWTTGKVPVWKNSVRNTWRVSAKVSETILKITIKGILKEFRKKVSKIRKGFPWEPQRNSEENCRRNSERNFLSISDIWKHAVGTPERIPGTFVQISCGCNFGRNSQWMFGRYSLTNFVNNSSRYSEKNSNYERSSMRNIWKVSKRNSGRNYQNTSDGYFQSSPMETFRWNSGRNFWRIIRTMNRFFGRTTRRILVWRKSGRNFWRISGKTSERILNF